MKEIFDKRQYIIETAEKFHYTNIKIYPDFEENSLFLVVEYSQNAKDIASLEAALESYLRRKLNILVSVVPESKLNVLQKNNFLSKCINLNDDYNEKLIEEKFHLSINNIKFKVAKEEDIDDVSILCAERQIKKFYEVEKNKDRPITEMQNKIAFNSNNSKRKLSPKEEGQKLFEKALLESENKKVKLDDVAIEFIQEAFNGYKEAAGKKGITIEDLAFYLEPNLNNGNTLT